MRRAASAERRCSGFQLAYADVYVGDRRPSEPEPRSGDDINRLVLDLSSTERRVLKFGSVGRDLPKPQLLHGNMAELQGNKALLDRVSRHAN